MADDERDQIPEEELERIDRRAAEDIVSRHGNIGIVARARTMRRLVARYGVTGRALGPTTASNARSRARSARPSTITARSRRT